MNTMNTMETETIALLLIPLLFIGIIYFNYDNIKGSKISETNFTTNYFTEPMIILSDMPITYKITNCTPYEEHRIVKAFYEIEKETDNKIYFKTSSILPEIDIYCYPDFQNYQEQNKLNSLGYVTADATMGLPSKVRFFGITENTYSGGCIDFPNVELHEIFHSLGIDHSNQTNNIMNPIASYCPSKINQDILDKLLDKYT